MKEHDAKYKILLDQTPMEINNQFITGAQLKQEAKVSADYGVWMKGQGQQQDKEIGNTESVDLSLPGREIFFTGPKDTTEGDK